MARHARDPKDVADGRACRMGSATRRTGSCRRNSCGACLRINGYISEISVAWLRPIHRHRLFRRRTPTASLKGLRVMAEGGAQPVEVQPPLSPRKYWNPEGDRGAEQDENTNFRLLSKLPKSRA